ncbi:hypothetical protein Fuma_04386 [Fuerstiella marisgermanici]|uniref:Uncharacterized protein n=1 Tax=Fuerstiella marisgermanici TaxID=1891926 RepID=A0A1P8WL19_9PLAN|nr:hypothetical protein Fuma_04386 [Fuerstiella marisgermanici]
MGWKGKTGTVATSVTVFTAGPNFRSGNDFQPIRRTWWRWGSEWFPDVRPMV